MATQTNSTTASVTTPAGLGFASRAEAFAQARDAARAAKEGPALDAAAEAEYVAAEALIETPAATPAQIAHKVAAFREVHHSGGTDQDRALRAIHSDLLDLDGIERRADWNAALTAFEAAKAKRDEIGAGEDDTSPAWEAACDEAWSLLGTLLATPAPDGPAMGEKARRNPRPDREGLLMRKNAPLRPDAFIRELLAHHMTVLVSRSGKLELLVCQTVLDGGGYREVPRHPDADAMKARFDALTDSERAGVSAYVFSLNEPGAYAERE